MILVFVKINGCHTERHLYRIRDNKSRRDKIVYFCVFYKYTTLENMVVYNLFSTFPSRWSRSAQHYTYSERIQKIFVFIFRRFSTLTWLWATSTSSKALEIFLFFFCYFYFVILYSEAKSKVILGLWSHD